MNCVGTDEYNISPLLSIIKWRVFGQRTWRSGRANVSWWVRIRPGTEVFSSLFSIPSWSQRCWLRCGNLAAPGKCWQPTTWRGYLFLQPLTQTVNLKLIESDIFVFSKLTWQGCLPGFCSLRRNKADHFCLSCKARWIISDSDLKQAQSSSLNIEKLPSPLSSASLSLDSSK